MLYDGGLSTSRLISSLEIQPDSEPVLEHLPEKIVTDLTEIAKWLYTNGKSTDYMKDYTKLRSAMLVNSLQG